MGKVTLWQEIKDYIGGLAFKVFLWSSNRTAEQYWDEVVEWECSCNLAKVKERIKKIEDCILLTQ